jgi:quercetin dioxygenase-like cupin family protein
MNQLLPKLSDISEDKQILFMIFESDVEIPEHSHAAQWGVVLEGEISLKIGNTEHVLRKSDEFYIPEGMKHSSGIKAGYRDITVFKQKDRYRRQH